jgi:hypothetical protein
MSRNVAFNSGKIAVTRQDANIRDVCAMIERLDKLFQEKESYSKFLASRGASAQELLDLLQDVSLAISRTYRELADRVSVAVRLRLESRTER